MIRVLCVGAARSGISVAKLLTSKGYQVILSDRSIIEDPSELINLGIEIYDGGHPDFLLTLDYEFIVKNPGIPYHVPFIKSLLALNKPIYTEIEVASWYTTNYEFYAITGTNGKTTITTLLQQLLATSYESYSVGNIGMPLASLYLEEGNKHFKIAAELSNFQLLGTRYFKPKVALVANLAPDHLDYMESLEAYYDSKFLISQNQDLNDYFILNLDDEEVVKRQHLVKAKIITLSTKVKADCYLKAEACYYGDVKLFDLASLKIVGEHNIFNAMCASLMAYLAKVDLDKLQTSLSEFIGVKHRLQYLQTINDVRYYNDSKATNPDAAYTALNAFNNPIIYLAGGYDKGLDFSSLKQFDSKVKVAICYGSTAKQLAEVFTNSIIVDDLLSATNLAYQLAKANDVVLLAPACASYDQFKSYEERGDYFIQLVNNLTITK